MTPVVGSEWIARDGRRMRVDEIDRPVTHGFQPRCKMTVLNARNGMRRKTTMSVSSFSDEFVSAFLRPAEIEPCK